MTEKSMAVNKFINKNMVVSVGYFNTSTFSVNINLDILIHIGL